VGAAESDDDDDKKRAAQARKLDWKNMTYTEGDPKASNNDRVEKIGNQT
jgi:hypothetical protein